MNEMEAKTGIRLVLFDFDGTLTKRDSLEAFLWYSLPFGTLLWSGLGLFFRLCVLIFTEERAVLAERAKATILQTFFAGRNKEELDRLGETFNQKHLPRILHPHVLERLRAYRDAGDRVVVVSASCDVWLRPFCTAEGIMLICTELAYDNGVFKGQFATPNCNREEKAKRIRQEYDLNTFDRVIAFGNSAGDAAMVDLAQEAWFVKPNGQMKKWPGKV